MKKIFISHSVKDVEIGNKFLDFIESLGFDKSNIFYSSKFHNGVELGKTFPDVVKNNFKESDLIVFLLTSNFYESPYCLNEMGAAWISDEKEIVPILLGNLSFSDMKGFIDSRTKTFSPQYSEPQELFSFFSKRAPEKFDNNIAKEKYNEFLTASISNVKLLESEISTKSQEILFEIKNSTEKYASEVSPIAIDFICKHPCRIMSCSFVVPFDCLLKSCCFVISIKGQIFQSCKPFNHTDVKFCSEFYRFSRFSSYYGSNPRLRQTDNPIRNTVCLVIVHIFLLCVNFL